MVRCICDDVDRTKDKARGVPLLYMRTCRSQDRNRVVRVCRAHRPTCNVDVHSSKHCSSHSTTRTHIIARERMVHSFCTTVKKSLPKVVKSCSVNIAWHMHLPSPKPRCLSWVVRQG
ncbi:hypothetical protein H310_11778 [Aphanomyces invadans]|uniref:Uncharacterized protein n=1 Tax=Aphanomyces invadans TaxID=157072 RepID=A0A024TKE4_9STRA|nr:hypothetical protein H310_11778 [Aphanomyces invadans]ETV94449.1 hypothetical protein H310_11778 [Aphanomyces invadans]|eukprot:XP_008876764.1 hypothetical protein H310_11778 [Aphanomyces invadans]